MSEAAVRRLNKNLREFNREVENYSKKLIPAEHIRFVKHIALDALRRIVLRTPVDTGRLRGNWQVGINDSPSGEVDGTDPTGSTAIQEGTSKLAALGFAQQVFITNNLPYAAAIEGGHSREKAPAGMVAITLTELRSMFP